MSATRAKPALQKGRRTDLCALDLGHAQRRAATQSPRSASHARHGRDHPGPIEDRRLVLVRPVETQHQVEFAFRRRQPVGFLVGTGALVLDGNHQRTVRLEFWVGAQAHRIAVDRIGDEEHLLVIHRERPESLDRRKLPLLEAKRVFVARLRRARAAKRAATSDRPRPADGWRRARPR